MATTTSPTAQWWHWVCSTHDEDLPAEVRQETVTLLYDQVGCMLASATLPSCQPVVALVRQACYWAWMPGRWSTRWGRRPRGGVICPAITSSRGTRSSPSTRTGSSMNACGG
jgi:hypothetical protein